MCCNETSLLYYVPIVPTGGPHPLHTVHAIRLSSRGRELVLMN
jgi:hypothetical protein